MQQEKQNNLASRLSKLDVLPPGVAFNEKATWRQLEKQLNKGRSNKLYFLLPAAAILLLLLGNYYFQNSESPTAPVVIIEQASQIQNSQPNQTTVAEVSAPKQNQIISKKHFVISKRSAENDSAAVLHATTQEQIPVDPISQALTDSITRQVVVKAPPRFRIAHINDIQNKARVFSEAPLTEKTVQVRRPLYATTIEIPIGDLKRTALKKSRPIFQPTEQ